MSILGVVGSVIGGLLGSEGAKDAGDAQVKAAKMQIDFAREQQAAQQKRLDKIKTSQGDTIRRGAKANAKAIRRARGSTLEAAKHERDANFGYARDARDTGNHLFRNALSEGMSGLYADRRNNIAGFEATRDRNIADFNRQRDASLGYFEPAIGLGNNALAAYGYNLGIGDKPAGYSGLELTPGAQFLLEQGRKTIEGGAAGQGGLYSGATLEALEDKRAGTVALDRDTQMAQLMNLGQTGQSAANSAAGVRSDYAGRIAGARDHATAGIADQRNYTTSNANALRNWASSGMAGVADNYANRATGITSDYWDTNAAARDTAAQRFIGNSADKVNALGQNRQFWATGAGNAANTFGQMTTNAMGNMGDARAAAAVGGANAWIGGMNNLAYGAGAGGFGGFGQIAGAPGGFMGGGGPAAGTGFLQSITSRLPWSY